MERSVLEMNVRIAIMSGYTSLPPSALIINHTGLPTGAGYLGEWQVFRDTYFQCLQLLEVVHDSVDMVCGLIGYVACSLLVLKNLVMPLTLLAANAFFVYPAEKGVSAALGLLMIGEAICLAIHETNTEVTYTSYL